MLKLILYSDIEYIFLAHTAFPHAVWAFFLVYRFVLLLSSSNTYITTKRRNSGAPIGVCVWFVIRRKCAAPYRRIHVVRRVMCYYYQMSRKVYIVIHLTNIEVFLYETKEKPKC